MNHLRTLFTLLISVALPTKGFCAKPASSKEEMIAHYNKVLTQPGTGFLIPPEGWAFADPKLLPSKAKMMVVGKGKKGYPPSINLTEEEYHGSVESYLKTVKKRSLEKGFKWQSLGKITTQAGKGELTKIESDTEWGRVEMMQVFLGKNGKLHVITAAALKEEYPQLYEEIFRSFQSFKVNL